MKTLQDLYTADQTLCSNFLDSLNLQVSVEINNAISLQVYFNDETGNYEYHTHSDTLAIGPKISKLTKFFSKDITDAITYLETKQEIINRYKFLNFVIYNKELYLLSAMNLGETTIIDGYVNIIDIANTFGVKSPLIIYRGRLTKDMQNQIINHLAFPTPIDSNEFKNKFMAIFNTEFNSDFPVDTWKNLDYLEGLIFSVNFGGQIAKYKIEDQQYIQIKKQKKAAMQMEYNAHIADRNNLIVLMNDWLSLKAARLDDSHIISLQKNIINMVKSPKLLNKFITAAAKLPPRRNSKFMLQMDLMIDELQTLVRKHGTPMRTLIEQFLLTYYKHKDNLDCDTEQHKIVDKIIEII